MSLRETYLASDGLELARLLRAGELAPGEAAACAAEIASDLDGELNAVVHSDFDRAAEAAPAAVEAGGPFAGVPFLLKDLYTPAAGLPLTNGSRLFADNVPVRDGGLVRRYRHAGLLMAGRTASPEFGLTTTTESALFGATRNPWRLDRIAGGSSGGSAAAVAAGIVPAAHASDGGGSIRIPASCCGVFGLKPSRTRTPLAPEGWAGLAADHCISRTVRDSAALLDAVTRPLAGDPWPAPPPPRSFLDETERDPGRLRIALAASSWSGVPVDPACAAAARGAAELCAELGHEVVEARPEVDGEALRVAANLLVGANLAATLAQSCKARGEALRDDEIEPLTRAMADLGRRHDATAYVRATRMVFGGGRRMAAFFAHGHDLLLTPTMAILPTKLGTLSLSNEGDDYWPAMKRTIAFTQLMNVAGNPAASLPWSESDAGLPIGVQFAAPIGGEAVLLRLAAQIERARPWIHRKPPVSAWRRQG